MPDFRSTGPPGVEAPAVEGTNIPVAGLKVPAAELTKLPDANGHCADCTYPGVADVNGTMTNFLTPR